jgi:DNA polymerase elongation subunit (family B)
MASRATAVDQRYGRNRAVHRHGQALTFALQKIAIVWSKDTRSSHVWLHGVTSHGLSVATKIQDFHPSFLIPVPETVVVDAVTWMHEENERLHHVLSTPPPICRVQSEQCTPFIGFTDNRKDALFRIYCHDITGYYALLKHYKQHVVTYHTEFNLRNQFLHATHVAYGESVTVKHYPVLELARQCTTANVEGCVSMHQLVRVRATEEATAPEATVSAYLKMYVRLTAVSQAGAVEDRAQQAHLIVPIATNLCDRVVGIALHLVWSNATPDDVPRTYVATTLPVPPNVLSPSLLSPPLLSPPRVENCTSEAELCGFLHRHVTRYDPDEIVFFPDVVHSLSYFVQRCQVLGVPQYARIDRFIAHTLLLPPVARKGERGGGGGGPPCHALACVGRSLIDLQAFLKKKVFIPVDSYTLHAVSSMPEFRQTPHTATHTLVERAPNLLVATIAGTHALLQHLLQDLLLLVSLDADACLRLEIGHISQQSDTDPSECVTKGEQVRVYNLLTHFVGQEQHYIDTAYLQRKPLRFDIRTHPPTFVDPPEQAANVALRRACQEALHAPHRTAAAVKSKAKPGTRAHELTARARLLAVGRRQSGDVVVVPAATLLRRGGAEVSDGGNVLSPACGFHPDKTVAVLDFISLYPNTMRAHNICYKNLVYEERYLGLAHVRYLYVAINPYETVAFAQQPGLLPKLLTQLVTARKAVKQRMGEDTTTTFQRAVLNGRQNTLKIMCNAAYGFTGVGPGALLAVKEIMYAVTSLGRYLQKSTIDYLWTEFKLLCLYGDTDSMFMWLQHVPGQTMDEITTKTGAAFHMDSFFGANVPFTWARVQARFHHLDLQALARADQIAAVLTLVGEHVCQACNTTYAAPVKLELENLAKNMWLGPVKKNYFYHQLDLTNPSVVTKLKRTGMPSKSRIWPPWVRRTLSAIEELISDHRVHAIPALLNTAVQRLVHRDVTFEELTVSCSYTCPADYQHECIMHLQVVNKLNRRRRTAVARNSRVSYVVLQGSKDQKLYQRSETPDYAREHQLPLDYVYYLKQLSKPVVKLLVYFPQILDTTTTFFNHWVRTLEFRQSRASDITDCARARDKQPLTVRDLVAHAHKRKPEASLVTPVRKPQNPFTKFL